MTKTELVTALCRQGYYRSEAGEAVDAILEIISQALERGERVQLNGFGTFEVKLYRGRRCTDISTGEMRVSQDMRVPVFRASPALRGRVCEGSHGGGSPVGEG